MINVQMAATIREMRKEDIKQVFEIGQATKLEKWSINDYEDEIERLNSITLVVEFSNQITAFAIARPIMTETCSGVLETNKEFNIKQQAFDSTNIEAEIYNIAVKNNLQNQGVGTILLKELLNRIARCSSNTVNKTSVWLEVRKLNCRAVHFYRKNKFEVCYVRKNFYSNPTDDALVMEYRF